MTTAAFKPMHHPDPGLLGAYAAGTLAEGASLMVAAHLTFCPECRAAVDEMESLGGALLEDLEPDGLGEDVLDGLLARLDEPEGEAEAPTRPPVAPALSGEWAALPGPIRSYLLGADTDPQGDVLPWRTLAPGVKQIRLMPRGETGSNARLFKVAPRTPLPDHGHEGGEWTLVLTGFFTDRAERFARGDVAEADAEVVHAPTTGAEECICLIITDAPLRYKGLLGRLFQPFTGM